MFWNDKDMVEEEWSLSAKLFAGLVFNPFSVTNTCNDPLISTTAQSYFLYTSAFGPHRGPVFVVS